ncbi:MAG: hypothetical protein EOP86_09075 [Verrucomicrobiaceae bacterium]|nr:MAG: hypothetical protein EOP86_09075 [Verrucomicrobiaceae bacterium]
MLVDNNGDMTLTADFYTGNTNAHGLIKLKEGQTYNFVCYMYEGGGGSNFVLRWELGDFVATGFDQGETPLRTQAVGPDDALYLTANAKVTNASNAFPAPFLPQARSIAAEAIAQNVAQTATSPIVLFKEAAAAAGTGSISGGAYTGTAAVMPVGAVDNYLTRVNGRIIVDNQNGTPGESLTLTFGVFADDGADFRIVGQDFTSVADQTGDGTAELADIGGDLGIAADYYTGNTNAFGVITLVEGEYDFEGHHYEGGGGSGYEVWWAAGEFTAFNSVAFRPISTDAGIALPGNTGIPLVQAAAPPAGDFAITSFTLNSGTGAYSLTFSSQTGTNYAVEYTTGFQPAGPPPSPLKWNIVPGKNSIPGAAGTTTTTGNISDLLAPGGQLPDGSKAFFRVRAL